MNPDEILRELASMKGARRIPETIESLKDGEIFVFGTDPAGEHRSRAARLAVEKFGAKPSLAYGPSGRSFALPVHRFNPAPMVAAVRNFLEYARANPQSEFLVLPVGCGAAGMDPAFVASMFREAIGIPNIRLRGNCCSSSRSLLTAPLLVCTSIRKIHRPGQSAERRARAA